MPPSPARRAASLVERIDVTAAFVEEIFKAVAVNATKVIQLTTQADRQFTTAPNSRAVELGADRAFGSGARLPDRVDAVMETVGAATWSHSLKSLRQGGTMVISGATSGATPANGELNRIFFLQLRVVGSTMGTRDELERLIEFCRLTGVRPVVDSGYPLARAAEAIGRLVTGDVMGKIVITMD